MRILSLEEMEFVAGGQGKPKSCGGGGGKSGHGGSGHGGSGHAKNSGHAKSGHQGSHAASSGQVCLPPPPPTC